jgi:nucleoid-associated protein YgaU
MGRMIPGIPYKSQSDSDANDFRNDCGPACVAMILNGLGVNVSTNAVYRKTGAKANEYVSVSQMMNAAATYGIDFDYFYPWNLDDLKRSIMGGRAFIPLVHYGEWSRLGLTQSSFTGPHFVVVVGFDEHYVYVNDPLWKDGRRSEGEHKAWTYDQFKKAWGNAHKDGNRDFSGIFCTHALPTISFGGGIDPVFPEEPEPEPESAFEVDPTIQRRIFAWAAYNGIPIPEITSPEVLSALTDAMGTWGLQVVTHTVAEDDTLPTIALKYYDDPLKWEVVVYFNGLAFQDSISPGDQLLIAEPNPEAVNPQEEEIPVEPEPEPEPEPPFVVDPILQRRILAWAAYHGIPIPEITSPAVVTSFSDAMGAWGLRVVIHTVTDEDTLPLIALKYYDDPLKWDVLVYFNGMTFVDTIYHGDSLLIAEPNPEPVVIPEEEIPVGRQYGVAGPMLRETR